MGLKNEILAENQYLQIREIQPSRIGLLTKFYGVFNKTGGVIIGKISWYAPWRQYAFSPEANTVWNPDCLDFISTFIKKIMEERKV